MTLRTWEVLKLLTRFTPKFRSVKKLKVTFPRNRSTHLPCDATRARPRSARACSVRRAVVVSHLESKLFSRIKATLHSCTRSNDDYLQSRPSSGKLGERTVDFELERKRACTRAELGCSACIWQNMRFPRRIVTRNRVKFRSVKKFRVTICAKFPYEVTYFQSGTFLKSHGPCSRLIVW